MRIRDGKLRITSFYQMIVGIVMGLGIVAYYEGLKRLKAAQVFVLELTTSFFASAIAYLTLGRP